MTENSQKTVEHRFSPEEIASRKKHVGSTLKCPYCDETLRKWHVPQNIWTQWPNEFFHVCFNNACTYFQRSRLEMSKQGYNATYRFSYDSDSNICRPMPELRYNSLQLSRVD